jgi:hypothetical protein
MLAVAVVCFVAGSAALLVADTFALQPLQTLAAVVVGSALVAYAAAVAVYEFGKTTHGMYFPGYPPPNEHAREPFVCPSDGVSSADAIAALSADERKSVKTYTDSRTCGPALYSNPPRDSPAALAFDGLLLRALHAQAIPLLGATQEPSCPPDAPTEAQLSDFIKGAVGNDALLPSIGDSVPLRVMCLLVRGCRTIQSAIDDAPRTLTHVEFFALRDGDTEAVHYEAQIAGSPMALVYFKRLGQVPSGDATCERGRRRA